MCCHIRMFLEIDQIKDKKKTHIWVAWDIYVSHIWLIAMSRQDELAMDVQGFEAVCISE